MKAGVDHNTVEIEPETTVELKRSGSGDDMERWWRVTARHSSRNLEPSYAFHRVGDQATAKRCPLTSFRGPVVSLH